MQTAVATAKVWIGGEWRESDAEGVFEPENPSTGEKLGREFPVSRWSDCDRALTAAVEAARELEQVPAEKIAAFLERYAAELEANAEAIVQAAHEETALPVSPRLKDVELPRTTDQLRQAAAAARQGTWRHVDHRSGEETIFVHGPDRAGGGLRPQQFSVRIQRRERRRFCRGHCRGQSGDRQSAPAACVHVAADGGGRSAGTRAFGTSVRDRADDLQGES